MLACIGLVTVSVQGTASTRHLQVIAGGGTAPAVAAGPYTLAGTIAQPLASASAGTASYRLGAGFWIPAGDDGRVFGNGFE